MNRRNRRVLLSLIFFITPTATFSMANQEALALKKANCKVSIAEQSFSPETHPLETILIKHRLATHRLFFGVSHEYILKIFFARPKGEYPLPPLPPAPVPPKVPFWKKPFRRTPPPPPAPSQPEWDFGGFDKSSPAEELYDFLSPHLKKNGIEFEAFKEIRAALSKVVSSPGYQFEFFERYLWTRYYTIRNSVKAAFEENQINFFGMFPPDSWNFVGEISPEIEFKINKIVADFFKKFEPASPSNFIFSAKAIPLPEASVSEDPILERELEAILKLAPPPLEKILESSSNNISHIVLLGSELDEYLNIISMRLLESSHKAHNSQKTDIRSLSLALNEAQHAFRLTQALTEKYSAFATMLNVLAKQLSSNDERLEFLMQRSAELEQGQSLARVQLQQAKTTFELVNENLRAVRATRLQELLAKTANALESKP